MMAMLVRKPFVETRRMIEEMVVETKDDADYWTEGAIELDAADSASSGLLECLIPLDLRLSWQT